jgi:pyrroline-5-carboxylate reductase
MPNTPALVGEGAAGLFANENVNKEEKDMVFTILN